MENLTQYQKQVLDKILPLLKNTVPNKELIRLCRIYDTLIKKETDEYLLNSFNSIIESNLSFVLNQDYRFQELSEYRKDHLLRAEDYIRDNIDISSWDGIDPYKELAKDFLEDCKLYQNKILDHTLEFFIPIGVRNSIDVIQFVSKEFLDEYKHSSKRKIDFLNQELKQLKGFLKPSTSIRKIEYNNPYPDYFNSYGYEIYKKFKSQFKQEIVLAEMSFLVDQLRKDGLMNNDKTLSNIFNFMTEELDVNFGTAVKLKSDFSTNKHINNYKLILDSYIKNQEL